MAAMHAGAQQGQTEMEFYSPSYSTAADRVFIPPRQHNVKSAADYVSDYRQKELLLRAEADERERARSADQLDRLATSEQRRIAADGGTSPCLNDTANAETQAAVDAATKIQATHRGNAARETMADTQQADSSNCAVFGADVDSDASILGVVIEALRWLEENHLDSEGVWRKAGSRKEARRLIAETNKHGAFPLADPKVHGAAGADLVAGMLTTLLGEVPGKLIGARITKTLLANSKAANPKSCFAIIKIGTSDNKCEMLAVFMQHWRRVLENQANQMNAKAIATCVFAPLFDGMDNLELIDIVAGMLAAPDEVSGVSPVLKIDEYLCFRN